MQTNIPEATIRFIQKQLTAWFAKHQRVLPWRKMRNPYATFVSECMLQQTQIKTVIPYFDRWMKTFPNIHSLVKAPLGKILKLWEGLGYYRRARHLHEAAKIMVKKYNGEIPSDYETLLSLPGIGRYTAGAIASIGFGRPVPLVDGNVARVFSRIFLIRKDILRPKTQNTLFELATKLVPEKNPGDFNQALMELGSLVCFPENPSCNSCPLKKVCGARQKGIQDELPIKAKAPAKQPVHLAAGIVTQNGKWLIRERPREGIWGNLWELPNVVVKNKKNAPEALRKSFAQLCGGECHIRKALPPLIHHLTHKTVTIYPYRLEIENGSKTKSSRRAAGNVKWVRAQDLRRLSFPVPFQKLLPVKYRRVI